MKSTLRKKIKELEARIEQLEAHFISTESTYILENTEDIVPIDWNAVVTNPGFITCKDIEALE